jgi:uncharacterized protein YcbK (DUF882 family)
MSLPVTAHFTIDEFACRDGSPYPVEQRDDEDPDGRTWFESRLVPLCQTLETIREAAGGAPMTIDSGYRTLAYDDRLYRKHVAAVGDDGLVASASSSQHPKGRAADVTHATLSPSALFDLILRLYEQGQLPHLGGVGRYPTFVHVDVRPRTNTGKHLAIWGGTRPSNVA